MDLSAAFLSGFSILANTSVTYKGRDIPAIWNTAAAAYEPQSQGMGFEFKGQTITALCLSSDVSDITNRDTLTRGGKSYRVESFTAGDSLTTLSLYFSNES